jgi:CheY-like chemotaxis protein
VSKPKLLLADDSATIQKVVNLTFEDEGIEVIGVGDGDAAIERFFDDRPDIVLADVNMPGANGYEVCEKIRSTADCRDLPVILLVGSFEPFDEAEAQRVGATDVLKKPFQSIRQLVTTVTDLLPKIEESAAEPENHNAPVLEVPEHEQHVPSDASPEQDLGEIDNLYNESFAETVEMPHVDIEPVVLGDVGMDDEIIETRLPESSVADQTREYNLADHQELGFNSPEPVEPAPEPELAHQAEEAASPFDTIAEETVFEPESEYVATYADEGGDYNEPETRRFDEEGNLLELPTAEYPADELINVPSTPPEVPGFPPELIEAIAQRVAEKITPSIVREIAWEVVPVIAESVIREKTGGGQPH